MNPAVAALLIALPLHQLGRGLLALPPLRLRHRLCVRLAAAVCVVRLRAALQAACLRADVALPPPPVVVGSARRDLPACLTFRVDALRLLHVC